MFDSPQPRPKLASILLGAALAGAACSPSQPGQAASPISVAVDQIASTPAEDTPSALDSMIDPTFPAPLIDTDLIVSGGPPPDGIPPIDQPSFETIDHVDWISPNEPVLSLELDGEARAYPIQIMTWHEIVNDTVGTTPVTVSYCPLCNSALAFDRRLGDRVLDFGTSGLLYNSSLVMYDRQTESLWTHFDGAAVVGVMTGEQLRTFPVSTVSYEDFVTAHPDGLVLSRSTGVNRDYGRNPYAGYDDPTGDPFLFDGPLDDRLLPQTRVVVIRAEGETVALEQTTVIERGTATVMVGETALVVFGTTGTSSALDESRIVDGRDVGSTNVFASRLDGVDLTFERLSRDRWRDHQTESEWNIFGEAITGPYKGEQLVAVAHLNTFWFAIAAFAPDALVVADE